MEQNKVVAIVTGAARGVGRAIAEALAAHGAYVAIVDVLEDQLQKTTEARRYIAIVTSETLYEFTKRTTMYVISVAVICQVKNE